MGASLEYLIADGATIAGVIDEVRSAWRRQGGGEVREHPEQDAELVVLDSFDGLLHAEGLACHWQHGRLSVVEREGGAERAGLPMGAGVGRPLSARELAPGRLRELLAPILELRVLLPLARVPVRVQMLDLLAGEEKTVVRAAVERPEGHPARLRVIPLRGYDAELARAQGIIAASAGLTPAEATLADQAVRAAGHPPEGIPAKVHVPLRRGARADLASARVLVALLSVIEANLDGTLQDLDSEFLHDLRVSVRRSRAVQREFKRAFPPPALARFRAEFKWLQQATGEARDLDVYVLGFEEMRELVPEGMRASLDPLRAVLQDHRRRAHEEMARALRSRRTTALLEGWREFLGRLPSLPREDREAAARPVEDVAAERIAKVYRRMVRMGTAIGPDSPAEDYHELRKKGKELRYLLELFGAPLFPDEVVAPMVKALKRLQDVLGHHQDREVQQATLRALGDEVARRPGGQEALIAMGALLLRLAEEERAARSQFAERFAGFAAKPQRTLVKSTFA